MSDLTQERLKELLRYDTTTGVFTNRINRGKSNAGKVVGTLCTAGYMQIRLDMKMCLLHRLAFLYMTGKIPENEVDHINRNRTDNRWCNLREATRHENFANKCNNADFVGVNWKHRHNKWYAFGRRCKGVRKYLGAYSTHLAACYARHAWELQQ